MFLVDEKGVYMRKDPDMFEKAARVMGACELMMYMTIRCNEFKTPDGVNEMKILRCSSNDIEESRGFLENLIKKGFVKRTKTGIVTTDKTIE